MHVSRVSSVALICAGIALHAQTAQISSRVTDGTGKVLPATSINVTNAATNIARSTPTNTDGYAVPAATGGLPAERRATSPQNGGLNANYLVNAPMINDTLRWAFKPDGQVTIKDNVN